MEQSSSMQRAQAIKLCELCQEGSIKWRCINCDKSMCEKCKTIHTRVPVTAKHQIVVIGTPIQDIPKKIAMDNIPCKNHPTRMTCMFCQTCNCLVCSECVSTNHSKHQSVPLETSMDRKLEQLRRDQYNIIDKLKYCESKNKEIQNVKSKYQRIFEESIEKIQKKEKQLKDAIGRCAKALQGKVENERSKILAAVSKVEKHIDQVRKGFEKQRDGIEKALKTTQGAMIFETKPSMQTPDISFDSLPKKVEHFFPEAEQMTQIQELFGSFQKMEAAIVTDQMDFKVLRTSTTDLPSILKVLVQNESSAWICNFNKPELRKIIIDGDCIKTSMQASFEIVDMDLTAENDIIFSNNANSEVKLLNSQSGKIKPVFTVAPLVPRGIHVTQDNKVIVGVRESGDPYKLTKKSQRAVVICDISGARRNLYQYDTNGKRLFTIPRKITTNINQDILVTDIMSDCTGRVVCLKWDGRVKYIYEGHPEFNVTKRFDPRDLSVTSVGHIIVNDFSNHALHVLSGRGDLILCKATTPLGIFYPKTIDIDRKGQLWVGCGTGGKKEGAQIHIVEIIW